MLMKKSMFNSCHAVSPVCRSAAARVNSERGGASLKMLIVLFVIAVGVYGIANYAPVAYESTEYKDVMQSKVDQAVAFGYTGEWVTSQLRANAAEFGVPPEAVITAVQKNGRMEAAVRYTRPIPLPGFTYKYEFDHTARSTNALNNSTASNN